MEMVFGYFRHAEFRLTGVVQKLKTLNHLVCGVSFYQTHLLYVKETNTILIQALL